MIQVAVVDDLLLNRSCLKLYLAQSTEVAVVYDTDDGHEFLNYLKGKDHHIDVLLLDLHMPKLSGFDLCQLIKENYPHIKILIVSQLTDVENVHKVLVTGADGFFSKNTDPFLLEAAILHVVKFEYYFSIDLTEVIKLAWDMPEIDKNKSPLVDISPVEKSVMMQTAKGKSSKEIGIMLDISKRTVDKHRENILKKTNQSNIIGSIIFALKHEILSIGDMN
ncbi:MAG: hypothetical protein CFE24_08965 [Flavobacterium sp. BFFFF2]|nr:MAG: hypothetical protein CFE24_08965 [Flavobacterium sp. BFFFF2]